MTARVAAALHGVIFADGEGRMDVYDSAAQALGALGYRMAPAVQDAQPCDADDDGPADVGDVSGRTLPPPVVETVAMDTVRAWATPEHAATIDAGRTWQAFEDSVLDPSVRTADGPVLVRGRRMGVTFARLRQMRELRYIRPIRRAAWGVTCRVFFVPKDETFDRLIWNGKPLNAMCRKPPPVRFPPLHQMLRVLTRPDIAGYLSFDFATWFVQLPCGPRVRDVFLVQSADGAVWRMAGIPMGWTWAPLVAQAVSETIVREARRRLGDPDWLVSYVYIDNVLFAIRDADGDLLVQRSRDVEGVFRSVCASAGAHIKESATVIGTDVDWLGVMLRAGSRQCSFRARFTEKVAAVDGDLAGGPVEMRLAWRAIAVAVRAMWVARHPLARIASALRWLVRAAAALSRRELRWDTRVMLWPSAVAELRAVYRWVAAGGRFDVWEPAERVIAWGASDAAGGAGGARGYIVRRGATVLAVRMPPLGVHINVEESSAMETGIVETASRCSDSGFIVWYGDNTVANGWQIRSWSPRAVRNGAIIVRAAIMERKRQEQVIRRVAGGDANIADILTRNDERAGRLRAGAFWRLTFRVECECDDLCDHVRAALAAICTAT